MQDDALPPPGFVPSVPSMPSTLVHAGEQRALLFTEPGGSNGADFLTSHPSPPLLTQAAASRCTHTTEGGYTTFCLWVQGRGQA